MNRPRAVACICSLRTGLTHERVQFLERGGLTLILATSFLLPVAVRVGATR